MSASTPRGISYQVVGSDASLPWCVITHGAFMASSDFLPQAQALRRNYRVVLWDLPAHGESRAVPFPHRLDGVAECLRELSDHLGIERAILVGHSYGGMACQAFIRAYPDRVAAFVAYGCIPLHLAQVPWPAMMVRVDRLLARAGRWKARFQKQCGGTSATQERIARLLAPQEMALRDVLYESMLHGLRSEPGWRFPCPVALIRGQDDDRFPGARKAMDAFAESIRPFPSLFVAGAGHCAHLDEPEGFTRVLEDALVQIRNPRPVQPRL